MDYAQALRRLNIENETELATVQENSQVLDLEIETVMRDVHLFQGIIVKLTKKKATWK